MRGLSCLTSDHLTFSQIDDTTLTTLLFLKEISFNMKQIKASLSSCIVHLTHSLMAKIGYSLIDRLFNHFPCFSQGWQFMELNGGYFWFWMDKRLKCTYSSL